VDVWDGRADRYADKETAEGMTEILRLFADWIYDKLEKEYRYQTSDEIVDENIRCNEYEFFKNGKIA
jgi:hypothetical protein